MLTDIGVKALAISSGYVLNVSNILEAALDLKRYGTRLDEFIQIIALVHILEREQVTLVFYLLAIGIDQRETHTTELGALTTVGATLETMLRGIADARIANAQGTMHKHLEFDIRHLAMNLGNLFGRELTRQNGTRKTYLLEPTYLVGCAVIGLRRGVNLERLTVHKLQQAHILHQDGVNAYPGQLINQFLRLVELMIVNDGVERNINFGTKLMSIITKLANIVDAVAYGCTGAKLGRTDINGIGTMIDGSYAASQILGWS